MKLQVAYPTWQSAVRQISLAVNNAFRVSTVTLTNSSTTTVVNDASCSTLSHISLTALDANAAAETPYISSRAQGTFTITHSNAVTTRAFSYSITNP